MLKRALIISAMSMALVGCAGAPLGLDLGQKPMAGTWKGTYLCPNLKLTRQDVVMTLQDGRVPGSVNGVVEMNFVYAGQKNYMKYTVVGSNVGGHFVAKGKQILQTTRSDFTMGPISGNMPDSDTIMAEGCGRLHALKRVSSTAQQTAQR
ncbi:hypothetical protein HNP46_000281 [Pseudomonas nitritireducens]|uniref:Lipoprotein n=1 Tax=Pseudomonas nitroreducens TaxID=46680 RepID=A0A7W7NZM5_PSENT|nr:hypothetical protein [Pseudomonas nitritireducens]MBB4861470.1 hypothetical protein [Pseudomonas nitritireducens]